MPYKDKKKAAFIEYEGVVLHLEEWARKTGIQSSTLAWRLDNGWSIKKTLSTKVKNKL